MPCTVQRGGGEPSRVLAKARALAAKGDYEAVWLVVDVDDHATLDTVLRQCDAGSETVVVSNPQFEVWLLWHFTESSAPHTAGSLRKELRRHGFVGACKHLPTDFPFGHVEDAVAIATSRSRSTDLNTRGPNPSSTMPHLVAALQGSADGI
nr:RloB family protein [Promicromonospora kroppenstedtii]